MGCDIHGWIEVKDEGEKRWDAVVTLETLGWRHYALFSYLFGVRTERSDAALAGHRGFPDDASWDAQRDYAEWNAVAHSPTWITAAELETVNYLRDGVWQNLSYHWRLILDLLKTCADVYGSEKARMVVWFDN